MSFRSPRAQPACIIGHNRINAILRAGVDAPTSVPFNLISRIPTDLIDKIVRAVTNYDTVTLCDLIDTVALTETKMKNDSDWWIALKKEMLLQIPHSVVYFQLNPAEITDVSKIRKILMNICTMHVDEMLEDTFDKYVEKIIGTQPYPQVEVDDDGNFTVMNGYEVEQWDDGKAFFDSNRDVIMSRLRSRFHKQRVRGREALLLALEEIDESLTRSNL